MNAAWQKWNLSALNKNILFYMGANTKVAVFQDPIKSVDICGS